MNKKGFISGETFASAGFWVLLVMGWGGTLLGYKFSQTLDSGALPLWQIIIILAAIFLAAAWFARD